MAGGRLVEDSDSEGFFTEKERLLILIGGLVILFCLDLFYWDDPSLKPWILIDGVLAAATVACIAIMNSQHDGGKIIWRALGLAFGVLCIILNALIWNVGNYGLLWGIGGAAVVLVVFFLFQYRPRSKRKIEGEEWS